MRFDTYLVDDIAGAAGQAQRAEAAGYAGLFTREARHDGFLPLVAAAGATGRIELGTAVAIAFARTPMTLAHLGHDMQILSGGRFVLGLGSQIRPHIEKRYSMPWSRPADRMRELVLALRAIWDCWNGGAPLDFRGEFYTHTLMTPMFVPPASPHGPPRVWVAGVGRRMVGVAGEVADGLVCHPLVSRRYLAEALLPALHAGARAAGRDPAGLEVAATAMVVTGRDEAEMAAAVTATRLQVAFYASTPAYKPVLDLHGWGDLQPVLRDLSKQGDWGAMGAAVPDELLRTVAVVAEPGAVGPALEERFGGLADRVGISSTTGGTRHALDDLVRSMSR
ncbi:MAG TPA: TIGR03617 family F420-dependent LLM class oxidoreductase [Acidimicrobiales bacterium]|nr:TIGR03617 family F420-dependent LLM class oxidoreductase [Acidimicrobiales bacterium]